MKVKASRNKTIQFSESEKKSLSEELIKINSKVSLCEIKNKIINQNLFEVLDYLPNNCIDLLIIDPPYNLTKKFNENKFFERSKEEYELWLESWLSKIIFSLKESSSIYICCDWHSSSSVEKVASKYFIPQNRITWEREKGRAAKSNWKNNSEDIWFFTKSNEYKFNVDAVKLKRKVIAPYKDENGNPKDWEKTDKGNFRLTAPSNIWTDITVPFWSMSENTDHPTQKPEKLIAKLILASSDENDFVFDPFLGSGTTAVTAKKLNRNFCGVEVDEYYSLLAAKRLNIAEHEKSIQGVHDGVFYERNVIREIKLPQNLKEKKHD
ncbi:MAG: site-specific DNA-methyltransferase [Chlorobiaceae bacterium]|nr:site-specific DNA-methyltransferase [Chlorobiaceae bacterium]